MKIFGNRKVKNDIILGIGLVILALCLMLIIHLCGKGDNYIVEIKIGNEVYGEYKLDVTNEVINIEIDGKENVIEIKDGYVYMKAANCPDKLCVHQGKITGKGQTIICLPHRIMITIKGGTNRYDGISQ